MSDETKLIDFNVILKTFEGELIPDRVIGDDGEPAMVPATLGRAVGEALMHDPTAQSEDDKMLRLMLWYRVRKPAAPVQIQDWEAAMIKKACGAVHPTMILGPILLLVSPQSLREAQVA